MTIRILASCGVVAITMAGASAALAQSSARPYRGLFGGDASEWTQTLSASGAASIGYDTSAFSQGDDGLPVPFVIPASMRSDARMYSLVNGGLSYSFNGERVQLGASASSTLRHYPQASLFVPGGYSAAVGMSFSLRSGTQFGVSQSYSAQPAMIFQPFVTIFEQPLGQVVAPDYDFAAADSRYTSYSTGAQVAQTLWRSAALSFSYGRQMAVFSKQDARYESQLAGGRFTQGIARGIGVRAGYSYGDTRYQGEAARVYRSHSIDAGIDYNRPISLSRRTRLSLGTGSAALTDGRLTRYEITGGARLTRDIGRTGQAVVGYTRNVGFYESLRAPFIYDSVDAALGGMFGRRLSYRSFAGVLFGELAASDGVTSRDRFDTWHAGSNLSFALTRNLAIAGDYVFYRAWFEAPLFILQDTTPMVHRHSVRVSLRAWVPLLQRGRRDGATR